MAYGGTVPITVIKLQPGYKVTGVKQLNVNDQNYNYTDSVAKKVNKSTNQKALTPNQFAKGLQGLQNLSYIRS